MAQPIRPGSTLPLVTLRRQLAAARKRGERFAWCWPTAVSDALRDVASGKERREWRDALERTRATWERCYDRLPATGLDRQLSLIRDGRDVQLPDVACEDCGRAITARGSRRYCSERCRRNANAARRPVAA